MTAPDRMSGNVWKVFVNTENPIALNKQLIRYGGRDRKHPWQRVKKKTKLWSKMFEMLTDG